MNKREIDLLNGSYVKLSSWNESVGWKSTEELDSWYGVIKIPVRYPFERESVIEIEKKDDYWSTASIITEIKKRLKYMYSQSKSKSMKNLYNDEWKGGYGVAYHCMEELWLESMSFNPDTGEVSIFIGS